MSSTNAPFGFRAAYSPSGTIREMAGTIASGYNTDIYTGQPVKMGSDGTIQVAAAGEALIGTFAGCQYLPSGAQRPVVSPSWPANTGATQIVAFYTMDPYLVYEIQADGSITQAEVGQQADFTNVANSNGLGYSTCTMDAATHDLGNYQLRIVGIANGINNAPGDAYTVVQVQIADHQYVATRNAI